MKNAIMKLLGRGEQQQEKAPPKFNPWIHNADAFQKGQQMRATHDAQVQKNGLKELLAGGDLKGARQHALSGADFGSVEQIDGMLSRMTKQQQAETTRKASLVASIVQPLLSVPEAERQKHAMQVKRELAAQGFSEQEIQGVDLSDVGIQQDLNMAMGLKERMSQRGFTTMGNEMVMTDKVTGKAGSTYTRPESYSEVATRENNAADNARADLTLEETQRHNRATEASARVSAAEGGSNVQSTFIDDKGMLHTIRRDGSIVPADIKARNPYQIVDMGGVPTAIDRETGQPIHISTPQEIAGNKSTIQTTVDNEADRRENQQKLPQKIQSLKESAATLNQLLETDLSTRYGRMSLVPAIPGTEMADTQALINQLSGQVFLQGFEALKGGGTITEVEGGKAEAAKTILQTQGIRVETAEAAMRDLISQFAAAEKKLTAAASATYAPLPANNPPLEYSPQTDTFDELPPGFRVVE